MTGTPLDRREAVQRLAAALGVALLGDPHAVWASVQSKGDGGREIAGYTADEIALLDDIADTILPETHTPGARAAHVGSFMAVMVADCYEPRDQEIFRRGMLQLDRTCKRRTGHPFHAASPSARLALLRVLDQQQKAHTDHMKPGDAPHYFHLMKSLALLGYFTSEIGCTQAQRYTEAPGRYDPCVPYVRGTPSWAEHG